MTSDNANSQEEPKRQAREIIDRIIRLSAGETMEQIEANPKPKHEATPREQAAVALGADERHSASMWIAKAIWSDLGEEA